MAYSWLARTALGWLVVGELSACQSAGDGARWASSKRWCTPNAPATSIPAAARDSLPAYDSVLDVRGRRASLAHVVPGGFGGFFLDFKDHAPTILLTDPSRRGEAIPVLAARGIDGMGIGPDVRVRRGRWDYAQLFEWYRYLDPRIAIPGVDFVSLGIDEVGNRIEYGVASKGGRKRLEQRLKALGVPCYLVAIRIEQYPVAASLGSY